MHKYNIKLKNDKSMTLYFDNADKAIKFCSEIGENVTEKDITEDTELVYMKYVNEIINNSKGIIYIKNKKHYLYNGDRGLIPVHLYEQDNFYFDDCQYIEGRYNTNMKSIEPFDGEYLYPIGWITSSLEEFLKIFKSKKEINLPMEFITKKQLVKEFKGQLINRKGEYIYKDKYGYYYLFDRNDVNNKEYKQFKGNKDAVCVEYAYNDYERKREWFNNIEEFKKKWNKEYELKDSSCKSSSAYYKVIKKGYDKLSPDERKVYLRLPYFNIHMYDKSNGSNNLKIHMVNMYLIKEMNKYRYLSADKEFLYCEDEFEKIVKIIWNYEN